MILPKASARLLGTLVSVVLVVGLAACSSQTEGDGRRTGENSPGEATPRKTNAAASAEIGTPASTRPSWDYVALGDSLAAGVGADRGYVGRYADHLRDDTGAKVRVTNLGVSGQTSDQLLDKIRDDPPTRRALGGAEVITLNIGINDLARAGRAYEAGTCGGVDNQGCLRGVVDRVGDNWGAITAEIIELRPADGTILRAAGLGYSPNVDGAFGPYVRETNRQIAVEATRRSIPYAEVRLAREDMSPDGVHPDGGGYAVISGRLRSLGYEPLDPAAER